MDWTWLIRQAGIIQVKQVDRTHLAAGMIQVGHIDMAHLETCMIQVGQIDMDHPAGWYDSGRTD